MKILNNTVIFSIKMAMTRNVNLAIVGTSVSSKASVVVSTIEAAVADGSVARDASISIIDSGDDSNVMGVSGGISVMLGKAVGNLSKSVGFGFGVSLALAVVVAAEAVAAEASVADVSSSVTTIVSAVANGSIARDTSMAVVYSSDDSNVVRVAGGIGVVLGKTVGNLAEGVSIGLSIRVGLGGNNGQQDLDNMFVKMAIKEGKTHNGKSFHL